MKKKGRDDKMTEILNLQNISEKRIWQLDAHFCDTNTEGQELSFTNFYMQKDQQPVFVITGEMHFSRVYEGYWEDEIIKMKMGGLNTVATYLFWIHHEEDEGVFDFSGRKDIRRFVQLCQKHHMDVILRLGPYSHGECRNGGFPDWMYSMPFDVRKLSDGYLYYVRRYFTEIGKQLQGLFYRDGGPIIACQIDNEYMHASSSWHFSAHAFREIMHGGSEGDTYMLALRDLALSCGITPAFFTATAWGGAIVPSEMMPMWGGYAFRPWMPMVNGVHPPTDEYVYQRFHENGVETSYDFHPRYLPEEKPYCCCEIGSGMMIGYNFRFIYPMRSVDAIANIKIASGCNLLGYYMYHGGSNPLMKCGSFTNDGSLPKISYDYQAPLGEYGQVRESYLRSKCVHYFARDFGETLCPMQTVTPAGASEIDPADTESLRYAVRTNGESGFLFIDNFQDHLDLPDRKNEEIVLRTRQGERVFHFDIDSGESAILPFDLDLCGIRLLLATAQPVTLFHGEVPSAVFFVPDGMKGEFEFEETAVIDKTGTNRFCFREISGKEILPEFTDAEVSSFSVRCGEKQLRILVMNRALSDRMYLTEWGLVFADVPVLSDGAHIRIETRSPENTVCTWPESFVLNMASAEQLPDTAGSGVLNKYLVRCETAEMSLSVANPAPHRYFVRFRKDAFKDVKDLVLAADYIGDVGNAFIGHTLISDNFNNGTTWEIGLAEFREMLQAKCIKEEWSAEPGDPDTTEILLLIVPEKKGARIVVDKLAAEKELVDAIDEQIKRIQLLPIYDIPVYQA